LEPGVHNCGLPRIGINLQYEDGRANDFIHDLVVMDARKNLASKIEDIVMLMHFTFAREKGWLASHILCFDCGSR